MASETPNLDKLGEVLKALGGTSADIGYQLSSITNEWFYTVSRRDDAGFWHASGTTVGEAISRLELISPGTTLRTDEVAALEQAAS